MVGLASGDGRRFEYDSSERLVRITFRDGSQTTFSNFDARNRPQVINFPGGGTAAVTYDTRGRMTSRTVDFGGYTVSDSFEFDPLSRLRKMGFTGEDVRYEFDGLGVNFKMVQKTHNETFERRISNTNLNGAPLVTDYPSGVQVGQQAVFLWSASDARCRWADPGLFDHLLEGIAAGGDADWAFGGHHPRGRLR